MTDTAYDPTPTTAQIEEWSRIILGLFGDGYSSDPDGLRVAEITAYAYLFAWCDNVLTQVGNEAYPQSAVDMLDEHEAALRLPNDSGVTDDERKARVLALRTLRGMNDASITRVLAALGTLGPGEYEGPTGADMLPELGLESFHALSSVLFVGAADLAEARVRQALALVLERGVDVSRFGPNHTKGSRLLASARGAIWDTGPVVAADGNPQVFGAVTIDRTADATAETDVRWTSRPRTFGPLAVVHLDDMRRTVRSLALQPDSGPSATTTPTMEGDLKCIASVSIGAGASVLVEDSGVWVNRFLIYSGQASTAADVRPGGAAENGDNARITPGFLDTAAGGVGNIATLITNVELYADAATGLRIRNTGGTTAYVNLFAWAASPYTGGAVGRLDPFGLSADSVTGIDATLWNAYVSALETRRGVAAAAWATGELRGLVHRTAMTPSMEVPAIAAPAAEYVIDSSIDWRDRFLVVSVGGFDVAAGGTKYPGGTDQDSGLAIDRNDPTSSAYAPFVFGYTGPGHAAAQTAAGQWDIAGGGPAPCCLYARTTGELVLALYAAAGPAGFDETFVVNVIGSFQLGVKVTPSAAAPPIPAAVAGGAVRPSQLNIPQDYATQEYARAPESASADLLTVPLGLDVYGVPPVARVHRTRRDRVTGFVQDAAKPLYRRERTDGGATCWSSGVYVALTHYVLDATQDWRDRWVYRLGTTSIGTSASKGWYTGPGMSAAAVAAVPATGYYTRISSSALYLYADDVTGALMLYIGAVGATVRNVIVGSPHLGGRSIYCGGRRSERPPVDIGNLYLWVTARRCVLSGSGARVVPVSEARAGTLHTATEINGYQLTGASAVGFSSGTTSYPWVGSRRGVGPALRVRAETDTVWDTNLTPGTFNFLSQGPMTLMFTFAMVDIARAYPSRAEVTDPLFMMFDCYDGSSGTSGFQISIDVEKNTLVFIRAQNVGAVLTLQRLGTSTAIRDGLPHYLVIRQTATLIELYLDGRLEATAPPLTLTQPVTLQPRLSYSYYAFATAYGLMSQAGFDLFEMSMHNAAFSDTQLRQMHGYLKKTHRRRLP